MAKKPQPDHTLVSQTRATWLASIVAAVALVISLFSLYEAHESRVSTVRDELLLRAHRPMGNQPIHFKKSAGGLRLESIEVPWDLLLSNTGNSTISITGYEILQIAGEGGEVFYSGMDGGLFNPEDKKPVFLPIIIEAGKSVRLTAVVGLRPGKLAYEAISASVQSDT